MSLPSQLRGLSEVKSALTVDPTGRLLDAAPQAQGASEGAAAVAVAVSSLVLAGRAAKLGELAMVLVKGARASSVTAIRPGGFLHVEVDPATSTNHVEKAVKGWAPPARGAAASAAPSTPPPPRAPTPPPRAAAPPSPRVTPPAPPPAAAAPRAAPARTAAGDPWSALRRALGRGQLNEAVSRQRELVSATGSGRPGAEPVAKEECDRAVRALLEGIGSVMAGDGVGGGRILGELASQQNLSFRWLALQWSARAALKSGSLPLARAQIQAALTVARQLDIEARALSQWTAAEVLAHDGDSTRALAWLAESRSRFERIGDRWGMGQTWLSEARVLTSAKREQAASEAARQAAAMMPDSDEPPVVLARLALIRDDLAEAEEILQPLRTQAAERVRALIEAIRTGVVNRADAGEFLREQEAPPSPRALRALQRIANAAPRFAQAREALAWMLLRLGRYEEAGAVFRGLLSHPLAPGDRASVMLGLGCVANAQRPGKAGAAPLRSVLDAGAVPAPAAAQADELPPLPALSASALLARAPQGGSGADAVFSGQLSSFALPDLLEFLRSARRTGLLVCSSASGMGALRFRQGFITGAASPATPGVAEILVRARRIPAEALRTIAPAKGDQPDLAVAEQLVREGLTDAPAVQAAFEQQISFAIRELASWKDGEFAFNREPDGAPERPELSVSMDPQGLLLNLFKELDEESRGEVVPDVETI